jgi:hypothetical protein
MALQRTRRPRVPKVLSGLGVGAPIQKHAGTGRSLRSLGSPLNARPLAAAKEGSLRRLPRRPEVESLQPSGGRADTSPG